MSSETSMDFFDKCYEDIREYDLAYSENENNIPTPPDWEEPSAENPATPQYSGESKLNHLEIANALLRALSQRESGKGPAPYHVIVIKVFLIYLEWGMIPELCDLASQLIALGFYFFNLYSEKNWTLLEHAVMTDSAELVGLFLEQSDGTGMEIPRINDAALRAIQFGKVNAFTTLLESGLLHPSLSQPKKVVELVKELRNL
jgi:ankyrin repeat protein